MRNEKSFTASSNVHPKLCEITMKKIIVGLLIACVTSACGWQLRGSIATHKNLQSVHLSFEDTHGPLEAEIKQILKANKIAVAEKSSEASLSLIVESEDYDRRTAAVGADALTSAYELIYTVHYDVRTAAGAPVTSLGTAMVTRTFDYSASGASSGAREEALLTGEMRREMAQLLIRRLNALGDNLTSVPIEADANGQASP